MSKGGYVITILSHKTLSFLSVKHSAKLYWSESCSHLFLCNPALHDCCAIKGLCQQIGSLIQHVLYTSVTVLHTAYKKDNVSTYMYMFMYTCTCRCKSDLEKQGVYRSGSNQIC